MPQVGVGPQLLEIVALTLLGQKDMSKNRAIINHYPL